MEFLDDYESKPRFVFKSRPLPNPSYSDEHSNSFRFSFLLKPTVIISLLFSILTFFIAFFYFTKVEPIKSILLWLAISLFLGPFAPPSLTAGDIRVGVGLPVKKIREHDTFVEMKEKYGRKSARKSNPHAVRSDVIVNDVVGGNTGMDG